MPTKQKRVTSAVPVGRPLHRHLVMQLLDASPFGAGLKRKLSKLDLEAHYGAIHPDALTLLDACALPSELRETVTDLRDLSMEEIARIWAGFDGETVPFSVTDMREVAAELPRLERLTISGLPVPLDVAPLIALRTFRHLRLAPKDMVFDTVKRKSRTVSNRPSFTQLEKAGFKVTGSAGGDFGFVEYDR